MQSAKQKSCGVVQFERAIGQGRAIRIVQRLQGFAFQATLAPAQSKETVLFMRVELLAYSGRFLRGKHWRPCRSRCGLYPMFTAP